MDAEIVVLTALPLEFAAIRALLRDPHRASDRSGTQFEVGTLGTGDGRVAIAQVGPGNHGSALLAGSAIMAFRPAAILFVGVAGGLSRDLRLGDVVVGTRVYAYHGGKEEDSGFSARPRAYEADHELLQRAMGVARRWARPGAPKVHFGPVAAGEVVLASRTSPLVERLRRHYNDAIAIEMESAGLAGAGHIYRVPTLAVRGISDHADGGKAAADAGGSQPRAARHAAEFAAEVIADFLASPEARARNDAAAPGPVQIITGTGPGVTVGAQYGNVYVREPEPARVVEWRPVSRPPRVPNLPELIGRRGTGATPTLELHLIPVLSPVRIDVRRLRTLSQEMAAQTPFEHGSDDQGAWACSADGGTGRYVGRSGLRTAWEPLPHDLLGAVLDEDWLIDHLEQQLDALSRPEVPLAVRYAPAVVIRPDTAVAVAPVSSLPRTTAPLRLGGVRLVVEPEESVVPEHLTGLARDVAAELAARLLATYRRYVR